MVYLHFVVVIVTLMMQSVVFTAVPCFGLVCDIWTMFVLYLPLLSQYYMLVLYILFLRLFFGTIPMLVLLDQCMILSYGSWHFPCLWNCDLNRRLSNCLVIVLILIISDSFVLWCFISFVLIVLVDFIMSVMEWYFIEMYYYVEIEWHVLCWLVLSFNNKL